MPLKRALRGQNDLLTAAEGVPVVSHHADQEIRIVQNARSAALFAIGLAYKKYGAALEKQQEVIMNIADMMMEVLAMESSVMRARKLAGSGKGANASDMAAVYVRDALARVETSARNVLGACSPSSIEILRSLTAVEPVDTIALRRAIAGRLLGRESYGV